MLEGWDEQLRLQSTSCFHCQFLISWFEPSNLKHKKVNKIYHCGRLIMILLLSMSTMSTNPTTFCTKYNDVLLPVDEGSNCRIAVKDKKLGKVASNGKKRCARGGADTTTAPNFHPYTCNPKPQHIYFFKDKNAPIPIHSLQLSLFKMFTWGAHTKSNF